MNNLFKNRYLLFFIFLSVFSISVLASDDNDDDDDDELEESDVLIVENDIGDAIVATAVSVDTLHVIVPAVNATVTDENDEMSVRDIDDNQLTIKPNSVVTQHPKELVNVKTIKRVSLLRGTLLVTVPSTAIIDYVVEAPFADLIVEGGQVPVNRALATPTKFSADYSQVQNTANLNVNVTSGTVKIVDRNNVTTILSAGQNYTVNNVVNRSSMILPIDGDFLYSNQQNTLSWSAYSNAAGYILEYTLPLPNFAEVNPAVPEFLSQSIYLYPPQYTVWNELVVMPFNITLPVGTKVEARVFPIDNAGNIISDSKGSDKGSYTVQ